MDMTFEEFHKIDKRELIDKCHWQLDHLADTLVDKLGLPVYYSIEPELIEIGRISKLMGALELFVSSEEEIETESFEGEDEDE